MNQPIKIYIMCLSLQFHASINFDKIDFHIFHLLISANEKESKMVFFAFKCASLNWCQIHCSLCEKKYIGSSADDLKGLSGPRSLHFLIVTYDALFQEDNIKMMKVVLELSDLS